MEATENMSIKLQLRKAFQNMLSPFQRKRKDTKNMNMKPHTITEDSSSNLFLTGAVLFANVDNSSSLGEYALKVAIGATIWVVMKITGDVISHKLRKK
jgi:hypothetical protein